MADDTTLNIKTVVDTSQLEAGMQRSAEAVNQFADQATVSFASVKEAEKALADAQAQLGQAAASGSAQAASIIAEYEAAVEAAKAAVAEETAAVDENTAAHIANTSAVGAGVSERASAIASVREFGAVLSGGGIGSLTSGLARVAGSSSALAPILSAAFPVIGAVALIDILSQIPVAIAKMQDALAGWDAEQKRIFEDSIKETSRLLSTYDDLALRQAEAFGPKAVSDFQKELARTQEEVNKLSQSLNDAGKESFITGFGPHGTTTKIGIPAFDVDSIREQAQKSIDDFNRLAREEAERKHLQIPAPEFVNWEASQASVREQLQKITEEMRAAGERMATEQEKITEGVTNAAQKATNEAQRRAEREQERVQEELKKQQLRLEQQAQKEEIAAFIASMEAQVQAAKQGSDERVDAVRAELEAVRLFYGEQSTEYQKMLGKLAAADRERTAELQRQTTQQLEDQLKATREQAAAQEQATLEAIKDRQKELDEANRLNEQEIANAARNEGRGGILDIGKVQAQFQQAIAAEQQYIQHSIALENEGAQAKIAALEKVVEAAEVAALADPANSAKFLADAQQAADKQAAIEQELQAKLKELRQKGADEARKIDDQIAQFKEQEAQRVAARLLQFEDQALFHSKSFSDAINNLFRDMTEKAVNQILMLANKWVLEHGVMLAASRLMHTIETALHLQAAAQQKTTTSVTNVADITSEAALAAATAYAAYAYNPPLAASMATAAEATVLSFLPEAAAESGYDVPYGASPITQLHPEEMVLPRDLANSVRQMTRFQGEFSGPGGGGSTTNNGGDFHFHSGDLNANALDRTGVGDILKSHQREVAKAAMKMFKGGQFSRK